MLLTLYVPSSRKTLPLSLSSLMHFLTSRSASSDNDLDTSGTDFFVSFRSIMAAIIFLFSERYEVPSYTTVRYHATLKNKYECLNKKYRRTKIIARFDSLQEL